VAVTPQGGPEDARELARAWTRAAASDRIERFPHFAAIRPDMWKTLLANSQFPAHTSHPFHGEVWSLPPRCNVTRQQPAGTP
jgi:hypothetical protein